MRVSPPHAPFLQDHGVFARHNKVNKFGTFLVKIEQTETQTKTQKTKKTMTKQKNESETEKTTVVEAPTAGQRAVGFRTLAEDCCTPGPRTPQRAPSGRTSLWPRR